ncbi:deoxyhypusine synthase isoform X2 [Tachypleus tridentatus]|uniref:deoxyhypusine synthase isoform X2 n=1 Tax=Tachypleus tridentatus TaxID=6853 RepID=UPI003FCF013C
MSSDSEILKRATEAVLKKSENYPGEKIAVKGYDFNDGIDYHALLQSYRTTGFQATSFGQAVEEINNMIQCRNSPPADRIDDVTEEDPFIRRKTNCTIFLGYTSNMASAGVREVIRFLVQHKMNMIWSPSKMITRFGKEINDSSSICYWAAKNEIPIFCPGITDGSIGDMLYFHSFKDPGLIVDIVQDIRRINAISLKAFNSGIIILGGGIVKHHICNANMMRNGADFSVYINTACEFDGSDSGARPDEAVSWGKIKREARPVKVYGDATLVFPLLVAETFARCHHEDSSKLSSC